MQLFKQPIAVNVTHEFEMPDIEEAVQPALNQFTHILRQAGLILAIGIPAVILFGFAAHVASEVAIDRLTE